MSVGALCLYVVRNHEGSRAEWQCWLEMKFEVRCFWCDSIFLMLFVILMIPFDQEHEEQNTYWRSSRCVVKPVKRHCEHREISRAPQA